MFDRTSFSRPANFGEVRLVFLILCWSTGVDKEPLTAKRLLQATTRMRKNAAYFRVNYALFVLAITVTCMLLNPASLLVLAFLALVWGYLFGWRTAPIVIGGRTFRHRFLARLNMQLFGGR